MRRSSYVLDWDADPIGVRRTNRRLTIDIAQLLEQVLLRRGVAVFEIHWIEFNRGPGEAKLLGGLDHFVDRCAIRPGPLAGADQHAQAFDAGAQCACGQTERMKLFNIRVANAAQLLEYAVEVLLSRVAQRVHLSRDGLHARASECVVDSLGNPSAAWRLIDTVFCQMPTR